MRVMTMFLLAGLTAPGFANAMDCPAANAAQPLRPTVLAPVANELAMGTQLDAPNGVLSQAYDESQSVDQVLLRIRIEGCRSVASMAPSVVPGVVNPEDPATYKPRTQFDNTPWRFNMSQNGKNMTADEFSVWMKSRGVRVARGSNAVPATMAPAQPPTNWPDTPAAPVTPTVQPPTTPATANPPTP